MLDPAGPRPFPELAPTDGIARDLPEIGVLLAAPRGFCAGVRRAIAAVRDALRVHGPPVYVRRAIVHNLAVVRQLEAEGAVFVQELDEVPSGGTVILSAHGVPPSVHLRARGLGLRTYDAVCPLVAKVHREVERHHRNGRHVVLVGHEAHPEIVGTLGHLPEGAASVVTTAQDAARLPLAREAAVGFAVQTTYAFDQAEQVIGVLQDRFPNLSGPAGSDICYATTNRQSALRAIAAVADAVVVAGESFSSNACRLAEVATAAGCRSVQLVADASELDWTRLPEKGEIGITAAASTPESTVAEILDALRSRYRLSVREVTTAEESVVFRPVAIA